MNGNKIIMTAAISAIAGVGIGAFGAHGLKDLLMENGYTETFETASFYHLVHSLGLLIIGIMKPNGRDKWLTRAAYSQLLGIIIFSGSLYLLSVTAYAKLGMITPIGGVFFILGWTCLCIWTFKKRKD